MPTPPTAERPAAEFNFIDKAVPEKVFNAEMRRIDYGQTGIEKALARIEARFDKIDERFDKMNAEIKSIRVDLSAKIDKVESGLNAKIDKMDAKIDSHFYWTVGTMIVLTGLFSSIVFAVFKG
ncbi:hypothetical protein AGMMS50276_31620 [Synergistales bacterium]|nr:hypothetical protein AGMMS50276_31620 [Synergistales bacterium]